MGYRPQYAKLGNGNSASGFNPAIPGPIGATTPSSGVFTTLLGNDLGSQVVNVQAYGATGNTQTVADAASTSASKTVTSATANFAAGDIGKKVWALATTGGSEGAALMVPVGTITGVPNSTTVVVSVAATASVTGLTLFWGTDDTAALQRAFSAAKTANRTVFFPGGWYMFSAQLADWTSSVPYTVPAIVGSGIDNTTLLITPDFNWTPVGANQSPILKVSNNFVSNTAYADFTFYGGGYDFHLSAPSTFGVSALQVAGSVGCLVRNIRISHFQFSGDSGTDGQIFDINSVGNNDVGKGAVLINCSAYACRGKGFNWQNSVGVSIGCASQECGNHDVDGNGGQFSDYGSTYADTSGGTDNFNVLIHSTTRANFYGTRLRGEVGVTMLGVTGTADVSLFGCEVNPNSGGNSTAISVGSGATLRIAGNKLHSFGTGVWVANSGFVYDMGGNTYVADTGSGGFSGTAAISYFPNLPTVDPHAIGQIWVNSGVLTLSSG